MNHLESPDYITPSPFAICLGLDGLALFSRAPGCAVNKAGVKGFFEFILMKLNQISGSLRLGASVEWPMDKFAALLGY